MDKMKKLGGAEREIMETIWNIGGAVCVNDIFDALGGSEWKYTTVATFLTRLSKKGYLSVKKQKNQNYYSSKLSREEYQTRQTYEFVEDMYGGAAGSAVAALCRGRVSEDDYNELMEILKKYDRHTRVEHAAPSVENFPQYDVEEPL